MKQDQIKNRQKPLQQAPSSADDQAAASLLPIDPQIGRPIKPMAQPGYYPGYHTLSQQDVWDKATRDLIRKRVEEVPPLRFFTPEEASFLEAICNRLLPQDDRDEAHKIPIINHIDDRLYHLRLSGYRYEDMPPDNEAYRLGMQAIEAIAQHIFRAPFVDLEPVKQDQVLLTIHQGQPPAAHDIWQRMSVHHFWLLLMQDVVTVYYAHPYAWDEIGYGGPAYPRGYMRLSRGQPEPWETQERRYEWEAPPSSLSDEHRMRGGPGQHKQQVPGQSGTH
jgi:hypothetical protein